MKLLLIFCSFLCSILYIESGHHEDNDPNSEIFPSGNNELVKDEFGNPQSITTKRESSLDAVENGVQNNVQCAVMYKNNEPVGILQPYQGSYRVLPTVVDRKLAPAKRAIKDPSIEEDSHIESLGYSDNKYPYVFIKFRIDSKLGTHTGPKSIAKRSLIEDESDKTNYDAVEEELGHILNDMSLMDDYPNSNIERKADDEDLEPGTNKINLVEEEHIKNRLKRNEFDNILHSSEIFVTIASEAPKLDAAELENSFLFSDSKQQGVKSAACVSPVATHQEYSTTIQEPIERRAKEFGKEDISMSKCDGGDAEDLDIDEDKKRVERGIRDKIRKLKEEVWNEISKLKKKKKGKGHFAEDNQRKKRQITKTLLDEENGEIDPNLNDDDDERVHIRRKRDIEFEDIEGRNISVSWNGYEMQSSKQLDGRNYEKIDDHVLDAEKNVG